MTSSSTRSSLFLRAAALSWALLSLPGAASAQAPEGPQSGWQLQWSSRFVQGFGSTVGSLDHKLVNELALRTDFLFGRAGNRAIRIGPALDVRTASFRTIEYAGGLMVLFPTHPGWPIQLSALGGYAHRFEFDPDQADGPIFVGTAAFGYRSYNYHGRYGVGINFFVSSRVHLDHPDAFEVTGGIELDFLLAYVVPAMMIRMAVQREDPDEPLEGDLDEDGVVDEQPAE